jgi:hypothetical protein
MLPLRFRRELHSLVADRSDLTKPSSVALDAYAGNQDWARLGVQILFCRSRTLESANR